MPVVINEFEVVNEAPPERSARGETNSRAEAKPMEARDVEAPLRELAAEQLRVWAH